MNKEGILGMTAFLSSAKPPLYLIRESDALKLQTRRSQHPQLVIIHLAGTRHLLKR